jgi:hypothetical protein
VKWCRCSEAPFRLRITEEQRQRPSLAQGHQARQRRNRRWLRLDRLPGLSDAAAGGWVHVRRDLLGARPLLAQFGCLGGGTRGVSTHQHDPQGWAERVALRSSSKN